MSDQFSDDDDPREVARLRRRLRGFGLHLVGYFVVVAAMFAVNFFVTPATPWFIAPMVGWGAFLAIHAAYAMGLLDGLFGQDRS